MSSRTYMLSIESIEPIKKAVGSKNQELLDALFQAFGEDADRRSYAENMIMSSVMKVSLAEGANCQMFLTDEERVVQSQR